MLAAVLMLASDALTFRLGSATPNPPEPLPLGGYTARVGKLCELPGKPIEARALILERGTARAAIVSTDLLTIPESLYDEVRKRLPKDLFVFLAATHTHCAPDSQMLNRRMDFSLPGIARFSPRWLDWTARQIAEAVKQAERQPALPLRGATLEMGRRSLNRGRRALAQPDTLAVRILGADKQALLTHYSAHAVLYGPAHNAPDPDYPGVIRGKGLFLAGAIGDMSPASSGPTPLSQIEHFGRTFLSGKWIGSHFTDQRLRALSVPLGTLEVRPNPEFARLNRIPGSLAESIIRRFAPATGSLTLLAIGKLVLVGIPGEPTAELGRRIRSAGWAAGFREVLTVSHCNGWMGYILAPEDYDRGGYEASLAFHGREFGNLVVQKAAEGLHALAKIRSERQPLASAQSARARELLRP